VLFLALGFFGTLSHCIQLTKQVIDLDEAFDLSLSIQLCLLIVCRMINQVSRETIGLQTHDSL
jgi:hypothetical protein